MINILAIGDIVGPEGLRYLREQLPGLKKSLQVDFCVVNGENADLRGVTGTQAEEILAAGADVVTLGNHTWDRPDIIGTMERTGRVLRPANFPPHLPGRGWGLFPGPAGEIAVIDLAGRQGLDCTPDNPFLLAERLVARPETKVILVEFHGESTAEKQSMGWMLAGKASAVWGTHTHTQTADEQILPGGTGWITDLGMTGAIRSVQGFRPDIAVERFRGSLPRLFEAGEGPMKLEGCLFTVDPGDGRCQKVRRIRLEEDAASK